MRAAARVNAGVQRCFAHPAVTRLPCRRYSLRSPPPPPPPPAHTRGTAVLHQLVSVVNYGGRVTDDKDARTIDVILRGFLNRSVAESPRHAFTSSGSYAVPLLADDAPTTGASGGSSSGGVHAALLSHIEALPAEADPEVFGLHANANVTADTNESDEALATLLALQPRATGGAATAGGDTTSASGSRAAAPKSREALIGDAARDIEARTPPLFDLAAVAAAYPVTYEESLNTVLQQECGERGGGGLI